MDRMTSRDLFGLPVRLTDLLLPGTCLVFALLAALFPSRVQDRPAVIMEMVLCVVLYPVVNVLARRARRHVPRFILRTASVQILIFFVYRASLRLVHVLVPRWFDPEIIRFEAAVFGGQPTIWLQQFTRPWLTEWLMFSYVCYVVIYPILSAILYFRHDEDKNEEYLFYVSLVVVLCTFGFLLLPVASPARGIGGLRFTVPLEGHLFAGISEYIRIHFHRPGGAFPSIHCGAATIMWWSAYRFSRPSFYVLAPIILSLYVSTVYGRFHYVSDVFAGIAAAFLAMVLGNLLIKVWNRDRVKS